MPKSKKSLNKGSTRKENFSPRNSDKEYSADESSMLHKYNSAPDGLSESEVSSRRTQYGYNELEVKKENVLLKFVKKFFGPVSLVLWVIIIITFLLSDYKDFYIISALLLFNGLISFWEEHKADNSLDLLRRRMRIKTGVFRDGRLGNSRQDHAGTAYRTPDIHA